MAGYAPTTRHERPSGWVVGVAIFAGIMMIITGLYQVFTGLAAIIRGGNFYRVAPNYVFEFSSAGWGWIHLILGVLIVVAGIAVLSGQLWARVVGIILAVLSAIANFLFIPYYPFWSILTIALDVVVIFALVSYDRRAAI